ncbi:hypothetical protein, partial [Sinorhizobium meliloti]|uniref:hypothetical protein n=1 Tax=Rhizobium meliloti TaxID=382 RepID=UPI001AECD06B
MKEQPPSGPAPPPWRDFFSNVKKEASGFLKVTGRLLPRRFRLDASDDFFVVDEAVEEVVPGF